VFEKSRKFNIDQSPNKANLGVGAYRDDAGKPWVLPPVQKAEHILSTKIDKSEINHEYAPITGLPAFVSASARMLFGDAHPAFKEERIDGAQVPGGTGAVAVAAHFLSSCHTSKDVYVSDPTWGNHHSICKRAGLSVKTYRYYKESDRSLDFDGFVADLKAAAPGSIVILHACAHNPTGVDPTKEQWKILAEVFLEHQLQPVFDIAYQGFVTGDPDEDAWAVRYFSTLPFTLFVCQSYSKNFGLYDERIGCLTVLGPNAATTKAIMSQIRTVIRSIWSNPPQHGARIVATILGDAALKAEWMGCLQSMAQRVFAMRKLLFDELVAIGAPGTWNHIVNQRGLFTYTGLTRDQCVALEKKHSIYLLDTGRINMCGINTHNAKYIAAAIKDVLGL